MRAWKAALLLLLLQVHIRWQLPRVPCITCMPSSCGPPCAGMPCNHAACMLLPTLQAHAVPLVTGADSSSCASGCTDRGTCYEELGRCDCPRGWSGDACDQAPRVSRQSSWQPALQVLRRPCVQQRGALHAQHVTGFSSPCGAAQAPDAMCKEFGFHGETNCSFASSLFVPCLNACNGRGTCLAGWCHCNPGAGEHVHAQQPHRSIVRHAASLASQLPCHVLREERAAMHACHALLPCRLLRHRLRPQPAPLCTAGAAAQGARAAGWPGLRAARTQAARLCL
jgi:hypothetical protein